MLPTELTERVFKIAQERKFITDRGYIICPHGKRMSREKIEAFFALCVKNQLEPTAAASNRHILNVLKI